MGTQAVEGKDLHENHNRDVRRTLDCLVDNFLVADLRKCVFFVPAVEFCGYLLGKGVRKPAPGKLMAIEKWETPNHGDSAESVPGVYQLLQCVCEGVCQN